MNSSVSLERGKFWRYTDKTERAWAMVLDSMGHSHYKTLSNDDKIKHIDIVSLSPTGELFTWEVKDAKRIYRQAEKQSVQLIFEHQTVADKYNEVHPGWGYSEAKYLVQRVSETEWLPVPMEIVRLLMTEVDWSKVYFKPGKVVTDKVAYTRHPSYEYPMAPIVMADGTSRMTRGDIIAHFPLSYVVTFDGVRMVKDGKRITTKETRERYGI